jgi:hypothetical protein
MNRAPFFFLVASALTACAAPTTSSPDAEPAIESSEQAIMNGNAGAPFPGVVKLNASTMSQGVCSAVILTPWIAATSRHCIMETNGVRAKEEDIKVSDASNRTGVYWVNPHPTLDVALVYLTSAWPVTWSGRRPLAPARPAAWSAAFCAGWGDNAANQGGNTGTGYGTLRSFASYVTDIGPDYFGVQNLYGQNFLHGDSGGGCFDANGRLLGINWAIDNDVSPKWSWVVPVEAIKPWLDLWVGP